MRDPRVNKFIYWTPRILSILFLLFLAMFSLDVFDLTTSFWSIILGLLIHNIPVFVLLVILIIAWRREMVGAVAYLLAGFLYAGWVLINAVIDGWEWYYLSWVLTLAGPMILIGVLFWLNWRKKKKDIVS